jgi:branched-chain amino acid transport system substrate-binding protein
MRVGLQVELADPMAQDIARLTAERALTVQDPAWIISVSLGSVARVVAEIRRYQTRSRIAIDAGISDLLPVLQAINPSNLVAVSPFSPQIVTRRPLAASVEQRVRAIANRPLTPATAVAATAVQVLASAVIAAKVTGGAYGEAVRDALKEVSLPESELIVPWSGVRFDSTFQNEGARVVAVGLRDNELLTVWPG